MTDLNSEKNIPRPHHFTVINTIIAAMNTSDITMLQLNSM
jgi:hypothetical protein